VLCG